MTYRTPVEDIAFALEHIAGVDGESCPPDLMRDLLSQAGRFADGALAPLHRASDIEGCALKEGAVSTPSGFAEAYRLYIEGGWGGVSAPAAYGGQALPYALGLATGEIWSAACSAFALAPMLTQSAIEALTLYGTERQKRDYLPKLISGAWTGTMNLTEPQAGSDVGALSCKARPDGNGAYRITGTKIFITFGEHDLTENIIHMVLARLPDAPSGTKGLSLFLVPKYLEGARNDVACIGLEEKLGIHGSPTCVMRYGENEGAMGFLVGEAHGGMRAMFSMMNPARLQVGMQGVAIAERAFQEALAFARERRQGRRADTPRGESAAIIEHPDVLRMLLTMRAAVSAGRALCYANAAEMDRGDDARAALLVPLSKAWSSDMGFEAASLGIQIHGGMGFIEETGAAQLMRDSRIAPIYEGTNGIQANDLVMRKLLGDDGVEMRDFLEDIGAVAEECGRSNDAALQKMASALEESRGALGDAANYMLKEGERNAIDNCLAGASVFLRLAGNVAGGFYLAKGALRAKALQNQNGGDSGDGGAFSDAFLHERIGLSRFYAESVLPLSPSLGRVAAAGAGALQTLSPTYQEGLA